MIPTLRVFQVLISGIYAGSVVIYWIILPRLFDLIPGEHGVRVKRYIDPFNDRLWPPFLAPTILVTAALLVIDRGSTAVLVLTALGLLGLIAVPVTTRGIVIPVNKRIHALNAARVVYVEETPERFAFAYGTLPSHVERGEERFEVQMHPDGSVWYVVSAFSRPGHPIAWAAYTMIRGAIVGWYPYPFLNPGIEPGVGYGGVLVYVIAIAAFILLMGAGVLALSRTTRPHASDHATPTGVADLEGARPVA